MPQGGASAPGRGVRPRSRSVLRARDRHATTIARGTALASSTGVYALIGSVLCLALNAFFVAAEFAIVRVRKTQLDRAGRLGDRRAISAKEVLDRLDRYLSVTQFGITVASLGLGWIGEPAVAAVADHLAVMATGVPLGSVGHVIVDIIGLSVLTYLHLLLGELVPKFIAIQSPVATLLVAARPLRLMSSAFRPLLWVFERSQHAVLRALQIDPTQANEATLTEDELLGMLALPASRDPKSDERRRILQRILRFTRRPIRHMMVPRVDVVALPIETSGEEAYALLQSVQFSRILLIRSSLDDVVGYLYAKDFLLDPTARSRRSLRGLERRVFFFPETRDGLSALRDMQREQTPFAVVVDEFGGTSGIITLEDLIEEIVGQIRDELDVEPALVAPLAGQPDAWEVDGSATVDDLREAGVPVPEEWPGEPLGGVVVGLLGHVPYPGDAVQLAKGLVAEVVATSRRRIRRLVVRLVPEGPTPEPGPGE